MEALRDMNKLLFPLLFLVSSVASADDTTATVPGMSWSAADSVSTNGTIPTMNWDTTATTAWSDVKRLPLPKSRRFNLHGQCVPSQFRGVFIENNHKIIIKQ